MGHPVVGYLALEMSTLFLMPRCKYVMLVEVPGVAQFYTLIYIYVYTYRIDTYNDIKLSIFEDGRNVVTKPLNIFKWEVL